MSSANFAPIYNILRGIEAPGVVFRGDKTSLQRLEEDVDTATREQFLTLAHTHPYAFGNLKQTATFQEAIEALQSMTGAFKRGFRKPNLEAHIVSLNSKAARQSFLFIRAIHGEDEALSKVIDDINMKPYREGVSIIVESLKRDPNVAERAFFAKHATAQSQLSCRGYFAAPGFIDQYSPNLVDLDLSYLWIRYVQPSISNLQSLVNLNLSYNPMKELPDSIGDLKSLRILNLRKCVNLATIPEGIGRCTTLKKLIVSATAITDLPQSLTDLADLQVVDVRKTRYNPNQSAVYRPLMLQGVNVKVEGAASSSTTHEGSSSLPELTGDPRRDVLSGAFQAHFGLGLPRGMRVLGGMSGMDVLDQLLARHLAEARSTSSSDQPSSSRQDGEESPPDCGVQ